VCASGPRASYTVPVTATETTRPEQPGAWLDEGEVNPEWAPPAGDPVHPSRVRRGLVYGGALLSLVLVVGLLYLAGGFEKRTDLLEPVAPGTLIVSGPFELRFTEATAQPQPEADGKIREWKIIAIGTARNTGEETMAPTIYGSNAMFVLEDPATDRIAEPTRATIGDSAGRLSNNRSDLGPGLPETSYRLEFSMPPEYTPGGTVSLGIAELVFEDPYLVTNEKTWDNGLFGWRIELPLRVLAAETF
jgi:hypothetical protein